jgi:pimeloyl-ACP methyl ester carboxylesterase
LGITRFATRGDHRLSYETSGEAAGMPLLALHDLLVDRGQLRPLAAALGGSGFRMVLPDARGHGASPMIAGQRYPATELAADMFAVIDAEGLPRVQILAVGWGAATALTMAFLAPNRVRSLALISPHMPALIADHPVDEAKKDGAALEDVILEAADAANKGQTDRALDLYLEARWGSGWRERISKPRLGAIRRAAANLGPLLAGMASEQVDRDALRTIAKPVTFLLRQDAPIFERWNAEALAMLIPGSSVQTVTIASDDEGHAAITPDWATVLTRVLLSQRD